MTIGALLPLAMALLAQAGYSLFDRRDAEDAGLEAKARALSAMMVDVVGPSVSFDDKKAIADGLSYVAPDPDFAFAAAVGADGTQLALRGTDAPALALSPIATVQVVGDLRIASAPVVSDGHQTATVFVALRNDRVYGQMIAGAIRAAAISVCGIVIALCVVLFLADKIAKRTAQMRIVLDNVDEGLATIRRDGTFEAECSAAFARWFGQPKGAFAAQLAGDDQQMSGLLQLGWDQLLAGMLPLELALQQFPDRLERDGRIFKIELQPLMSGESVSGALLRIHDVTAEVEAQQTFIAQQEYVAVFERALADPHSVREMIEDTGAMIASLETITDATVRTRIAHTVKGNAGMFGISSVSEVAHRLEDSMLATGEADPADIAALHAAWNRFAERAAKLVGEKRDKLEVKRSEIESLAVLAERGQPIAEQLRAMFLEPVAIRLASYESQIVRVAERLGKPAPEVVVDAKDVRIESEMLRPFWAAFAHLVRNAVDHGLESPDERVAAGKPEAGRLQLVARYTNDALVIEVVDDGRGIVWDRVREKAEAAGLPSATEHDLIKALFSDGVSTADEVSETSGRGVGLAAVDSVVRELGGEIAVQSELGKGTRFTFTFSGRAPRRASMARVA